MINEFTQSLINLKFKHYTYRLVLGILQVLNPA